MYRLFQHLVFLTLREYLTQPVSYSTYVNHQLNIIKSHFGDVLDHAALDQEWVYLKQLLTEGLKQLSTREVLEMIIKDQSLRTVLPQTVSGQYFSHSPCFHCWLRARFFSSQTHKNCSKKSPENTNTWLPDANISGGTWTWTFRFWECSYSLGIIEESTP